MAELEQQSWQSRIAGVTLEGNDFASLLNKEFKPKPTKPRSAVEAAVQTLAQQALAQHQADRHRHRQDHRGDDRRDRPQAVRAGQRDPAPRGLPEARGGLARPALHGQQHRDRRDPEDPRDERSPRRTWARRSKYKGTAWDQIPIFKKLYEEEYGQFGGEPFGAIVGDYHFDHSPPDVELLGEMAKIAAAAHAPFITGAAPTLMQMESWQELANPRDLTKIFPTPEYAAWRSLRESDDARYIGLCMPRFLAACPTAPRPTRSRSSTSRRTPPAPTTTSTPGPTRPTRWRPTSTARSRCTAGARASAASSRAARCENLPTHTFPTDDGGVDMKCPTEIAITDRREAELSKNGFMPLIHRKNSDFAAFIGAQSLQKPAEYDDPDATANAELAARLPYLFACNRFAHYLKCIVRDKVGSFKEREAWSAGSTSGSCNYVDGDPANSTEDTKAQRPLAAAEVVVEEVEGNPGLLPVEVLPAAALPARGPDGVAAAGFEAAVREGLRPRSRLIVR